MQIFNKKLIFLFISFSIMIILLNGLILNDFYDKAYYDFVCDIAIISEEAPESLNTIVSRISTSSNSKSLYEKGKTILFSLGYGEIGQEYLRKQYQSPGLFLCIFFTIISCFSILAFHCFIIIKRIYNNIKEMIFKVEHAMTIYPAKIENSSYLFPVLDELSNQINSLVGQLNHQIELLKIAQDERTIFIENISHQIKTPLTCISLDLELLSTLDDNDKINEYINSCYSQIDHIEALINRLLKIGKLESGKVHYEFYEHNLIDTIFVLCNNLEENYPDKPTVLNYDPNENYILSYDIIWLYEALENIAKNCYLYSHDQSGVEIDVVKYESYIKIVLRDYGIGISPSDLPNIFDRFYRSKQNADRDGFGIGLNLAKLVIEGHHGSIFAQSNNQSTQFIIHLPLIY